MSELTPGQIMRKKMTEAADKAIKAQPVQAPKKTIRLLPSGPLGTRYGTFGGKRMRNTKRKIRRRKR